MEDIKIDIKMIIIIICISVLGGALLWLGYNLYTSVTKNEDEEIKYFEGDMTSEVESLDKNITSDANNKLNLDEIIETGFRLNNNNPHKASEGWVRRKIEYSYAGHHTMEYYVPSDWVEDILSVGTEGVDIRRDAFEIENLTSDTTYEEFLDIFMKQLNARNWHKDKTDYSIRELNINDEIFYIIEESQYLVKDLHFCLFKDGFVFYITATVANDYYNQQTLDIINGIFSTFTIY